MTAIFFKKKVLCGVSRYIYAARTACPYQGQVFDLECMVPISDYCDTKCGGPNYHLNQKGSLIEKIEINVTRITLSQ